MPTGPLRTNWSNTSGDRSFGATFLNLVGNTVNAIHNKIALIQDGATANSSDAALRDRGTHTGQQPSTTISDFTEAVQDAVASLLQGTSGVSLSYNDAANTLTITGGGAGGLDAEAVRDAIGPVIVGIGNISVLVNDDADTITVTTTATVNSTDAALRDRGTHTGTQDVSTVNGAVKGSVNGVQTNLTVWKGTAAQYAALGVKDANTVYLTT